MGWRSRMLASFPLQADAPDFGRTTRCCCRRSGCSRDLRHPQRLSSWLRHETRAASSTARRARRATGRTGAGSPDHGRLRHAAARFHRLQLRHPASPTPTGSRSCTTAGPSARSTAGCRRSARRCPRPRCSTTIDYVAPLLPRAARGRAASSTCRAPSSPRRRFPKTKPS